VAHEEYKKQAAEAAVELVQSGMVLGLGHGSTVQFALEALGAKIKDSQLKNIIGIPCSKQTEAEARRLGIPLADFNDHASIDLTLDGADEVDPDLNLIKGGGGALLREKIVAQASRREVIMIDESKLSEKLGSRVPLPIEVAQFGWVRQQAFIAALGGKATLRVDTNGKPVLSDQGNYLLDCNFGPIEDLHALARSLEARSGILEHGLFLGLASDVIVAGAKGMQHLRTK
jgi:ribose 5-phosphate isomerase A